VEETSPLPVTRGTLFIKAVLYPAHGPTLEGYVVGLRSVYAIGIFVGDVEVGFNRQLGDLVQQESSRLFAALGTASFELFPLEFTTEFHFPDEGNVAGLFTIDE
jgi:hypothetical protein